MSPKTGIVRSSQIVILLLFSSILQAQEGEGEEVFELSPFEVSVANDRGYLSTNSISGTSLDTLIRDLPMPLEVINRELIEDLQATDLEESLEYSAGVYLQSFRNTRGANEGDFYDSSPSSTDLNAPFTNTISLRGYTVPNHQRFGFRVGAIVPRYNVVLGGSTDTVTTERIEVVRGPQALLYGINVLSGVVNIIPKEPLFDPAYRVNISGGNYNFLRAELDATGPLIKDKLAYRLLGSYTEEGHWTMFRETEREDYALQMKWRITPRYDLFLEVKKSDFHQSGIGPQYFYDNDPVGSSQFRWENEWDEGIIFGRDSIDAPIISDRGEVHESPWVPREDVEYADKLYDLGPNYRISGPDTYFDRDEITLTALLRARFTENLSGEFGIYSVEQEEKVFNVNLTTFNGSRGPIRPTFAPEGFFGKPPTERQITTAMALWFNNPEISLNGTRGPLDVYQDAAYDLTKGLGDPFVFPYYKAAETYPIKLPVENAQEFDDVQSPSYNRRYARYVWYEDQNDAETIQMRARLAYTFDLDIFGAPANHTLSAGANYINDSVDFNDASVSADNDNYVYSSNQVDTDNHRQDEDPWYLRQSVLDLEPMRYNGETVAMLANPSFYQLADFKSGETTGQDGNYIARSGKREASLWYRGFYGLYQGKFWEDKLHLVAGLREDQYQVKESEQLIIIDQDRVSDVWQGSVDPITPWLIGDGRGAYKSPVGIPDELDANVREDYARLQEMQPKGTTDYNFPEYQDFTTGTFGFSYRITDPISFYYLYSEGVFPNTGQRDGNYDPIDAEQTVNNEIGIKFDLMEGKISGTLSFFEIKRDNAVYYWSWAPNPQAWHGGINPPTSATSIYAFSPQAATGPGSGYLNGQYYPVVYGVGMEWVEKAFEEMGMADQFPSSGGSFRSDAFTPWGALEDGVTVRRAVEAPTILERTYLYTTVDALENNPNAEVLRLAYEMALASEDPFGIPLFYWSTDDVQNNNPSNNRGSNVTFSEKGKGVDGQIIYSPTPNYQIMLTYSYQKREVTDFNLVDAVDSSTGINWGTRYDAWIYLLGVENFEDPTRASTFNGGSLKGIDLSFVPQYSAKLWNMYRFSDGPLEGLRIGGGVQYIGEAPTSVPLGGARLAANRFPTPDTPERFILDASLSYNWQWADIDWFLSLRVSNLLDDTGDTVYAHYVSELGTDENRRTQVYYAPRTWRLSLSARF